jgi:hypothetical protein
MTLGTPPEASQVPGPGMRAEIQQKRTSTTWWRRRSPSADAFARDRQLVSPPADVIAGAAVKKFQSGHQNTKAFKWCMY